MQSHQQQIILEGSKNLNFKNIQGNPRPHRWRLLSKIKRDIISRFKTKII